MKTLIVNIDDYGFNIGNSLYGAGGNICRTDEDNKTVEVDENLPNLSDASMSLSEAVSILIDCEERELAASVQAIGRQVMVKAQRQLEVNKQQAKRKAFVDAAEKVYTENGFSLGALFDAGFKAPEKE